MGAPAEVRRKVGTGLLTGAEQQERPVEPTPQATPAPRQQPEPPTAAAAPNQLSSSGDDGGSLSSTTIVLIGIAIILALGAVMSFLLMMFLQNQRTGHSA